MKKNSILLFAASLILTMVISVPVSAQKKQPVGVRMEITEAETDKGDFTVFTYVDLHLAWRYLRRSIRFARFHDGSLR